MKNGEMDLIKKTTKLSESMNSLLELLLRVGVSLSLVLCRPEQRSPPPQVVSLTGQQW